ncbi:hypothetical protein TNCV_160871 [Trichonephila clavipes]|nr:hypothetical protein TNCV_160871 [Trichonephila clavipes]
MIFLNTAGHGVGSLTVKLRYNVFNPPEKLCKFDVTVNVTEVKKERKAVPHIVNFKGKDYFNKILPEDLVKIAPAKEERVALDRQARGNSRTNNDGRQTFDDVQWKLMLLSGMNGNTGLWCPLYKKLLQAVNIEDVMSRQRDSC